MVTHQSSPHVTNADIPEPKGIPCVEQIWHSSSLSDGMKINTPHWVPIVAKVWFLRQ